ncbi:MAG: hypothetical protein AAGK03_21090 [Pseudomonadota bacterium]
MPRSLDAFFRHLSSAFFAEDYDAVVQHYRYPLPFTALDELIIFGSPERYADALRIYNEKMKENRIVGFEAQVRDGETVNDAFRKVRVDWKQHDKDGNVYDVFHASYVLSWPEDQKYPKIEMVDYDDLSIAEIVEKMAMVSVDKVTRSA